ncbi:hypothetical protein OPKNFCMD_5412 [Methylobacterium crusticola]|uniref:Glycoside-hydrolase family GH114 TIM-barrel domain-containing protein n=1 Tax=Methylobacterium crusticola TaxID=1697972 RepID=A0ABQ4R5R0_9HYPH|nr:endo alpha-1,4 polygalactosaminidase [Methylobacterium crusticola]GJD52646.1 hypothetical protein OPKNFCMD_5412 [Methylobacterium crusticola]
MKTGMYVLQGVNPAQIAAAPFDVKVVEIYDSDGRLFDPVQVRQMGGGPGGALLLGYFSIGEAEDYRAYWNTIPKSAIGPVDPNWKGNYEVKYWTDEWKTIAKREIDKIVSMGYDGAYFDVVDEFQLPWAKQNAPGGDAAGAMKNLIGDLSDYAKSKVPTFKIWVNGGEELLTDQNYLSRIDGLFKENLFYNSDGSAPQPRAETRWSLDYLKRAQAAGKDVVAIEYVSGPAKIADVQAKADAAGFASYIARLDLDGVSLDGVRPSQVMRDDGLSDPAAPPTAAPMPADDTSGSDPLAELAGDDLFGEPEPGGADRFPVQDQRTSDTALVTGDEAASGDASVRPTAEGYGAAWLCDRDPARTQDVVEGGAEPALVGKDDTIV